MIRDVSGQRILVGLLDGGFWRSLDGGETWSALNQSMLAIPGARITSALDLQALDAAADTIIAKMTNEGDPASQFSQYVISTDGGDSWQLVDPGNANDWTRWQHLRVDRWNHHRLWFLNNAHMATSPDFGQSWQTWVYDDFFSGHSKDFFLQDTQDSLTFYTGFLPVGDSPVWSVWKSEDGGTTWAPSFDPDTLVGLSPSILWLTGHPDGGLLALSPVEEHQQTGEITVVNRLWRESGDDQSWSTRVLSIPPEQDVASLVIDPDDPSHWLVGGWMTDLIALGMHSSFDEGQTWTRNSSGLPDELTVAKPFTTHPQESLYTSAHGWGVYRYDPGNSAWTIEDLHLPVSRGLLFTVREHGISARGVNDSRLHEYSFATESWENLQLPAVPAGSLAVTLPVSLGEDAHRIVTRALYPEDDTDHAPLEILESYDHGSSWQVRNRLAPPAVDCGWTPRRSPGIVSDENRAVLVFPRSAVGTTLTPVVSVSVDSGRSWNHANFTESLHGASVALSAGRLYLANRNSGVFASDDWGESWVSLDFPDPAELNSLGNKQIFANPETGDLFVFGASHLYRYHESNWQSLATYDWPPPDNALLPGDPPVLVSLMRNQDWFDFHQVMVSHDRGETWHAIGVEFPYAEQFTTVYQIQYDPWRELLWLSTPLGLMTLSTDELRVVERGGRVQARPFNFDLLACWPNPCNDVARIRYQVVREGQVRLTLVNIQGQRVRTLVAGEQQPGVRDVALDVGDLASGHYYLQLSQPGSAAVQTKLNVLH